MTKSSDSARLIKDPLPNKTVWKLLVNPKSSKCNDRPKPNANDVINYIQNMGIIGVGWGISECDPANNDFMVAYSRAANKYSTKKSGFSNVRRFVNEMKIGDFVWVRRGHTYMFFVVTGEPEYQCGEEWDCYDFHFIRKAKMVAKSTDIPIGPVVTAFSRPARTLERFGNHKELIKLYSWAVCSENDCKLCPPLDQQHLVYLKGQLGRDTTLLNLLSPEALEDAVGMYLQVREKYIFVPSSRNRKGNTPKFEYLLIDPEASSPEKSIISVQVKTGALNVSEYSNNGRWVLFSRDFELKNVNNNIEIIQKKDLETFLWDNEHLFTLEMRTWANFLRKYNLVSK
ncbi:hypothetical protein [Oceanithermus sp.]